MHQAVFRTTAPAGYGTSPRQAGHAGNGEANAQWVPGNRDLASAGGRFMIDNPFPRLNG
jgi:hypothetical protein